MTSACACCGDLLHRLDRRRLLRLAGAAGVTFALQPFAALAAEGHYEAMVLSCIDPRFPEPVRNYTHQRGLTGKFSQFVIAGGAIGVVHPAFQAWHQAFWDNLSVSLELHHIGTVIALNHRECGAAKKAYGDPKVADRQSETETHRAALAEFRQQVAQRHPRLRVETGLMALDGSVEMFT
jgi:carbonic anhydrase